MAEALVNSLALAGNLNDVHMAETQVSGIKATDDLIATLTRLAISHDRQLQTLEDRHTIIVLIYGQQEKAKVRGIRDEWQRQPTKEHCIRLVPRSEVLYGRRFWSFYNSITAS